MTTPKHIAISLDDISDWCRKNNIEIGEGCKRYFGCLGRLLELQVHLNIPISTIHLLSENFEKSTDDYLIFCDFIKEFFNELVNNSIIVGQKIKISVFGKWYNLPGKTVESLKNLIASTKEYDNFFVNFCINYDGQEEIVDACKLIAKQVELGKIDPEMITKGSIKENMYSSYFLPPDIILIYGERKLTGLLLWDSVSSRIEFAGKSFMEFEEEDIKNILDK
ncbi:undecaprenyl diphosphate synthase family protein [Candidatus Woesearchaeota archaeon]|nr:undecaprenyl diphosphate synthase family protein [Candidatus Woesearchaeota archaeon]